MPVVLPIVAVLLALISDEVQQGKQAAPASIEDLVRRIKTRWPEIGSTPLRLEDEDELVGLVRGLWEAQGGWPVAIPWGELVEDPFETRRAAVDLALSWPEVQELVEPSLVASSRPGDLRVAFPDVHKDPDGRFWIDVSADPVLASASGGSPIADPFDAARYPRPYWIVKIFVGTRLYVEPVANNPLLTGVGAGGKPIDKFDLDVLSGKTEHDLVAKKRARLQSGRATIDDVKYLLLGTVPFQFGPDGAQGGWYSAGDARGNRGGRQGFDESEVVWRDAWMLKRWGFSVPKLSLERGAFSADLWSQWIGGPITRIGDEAISDPRAYLRFLREWTKRGIYGYSEDALRDIARKSSREALETFLDRDLRLFIRDPSAWRARHHCKDAVLLDVLRMGMRLLEEQAEKAALRGVLDIEGEDSASDDSVRRHLYHPERRVSVRNALLAVHRAQLGVVDPRWAQWRGILLAWIRWGQSDWLAYEQAIIFFAQAEDLDGLSASLHLPDPTNRRYALVPMIKFAPEEAQLHLLDREDHPEVISYALSSWEEIRGADSARSLALDMKLAERLRALPPPDEMDPFLKYEWDQVRAKIKVLRP